MNNKEWLLTSIGAIIQVSTYFSNARNIPIITYILQGFVFLILIFLILIILYKFLIVFIACFDVTIATYKSPRDGIVDGEKHDKSKIVYDYILNNGMAFIVSNRLFGDVKHSEKKTLYLTYFIWGKGWDTIVQENQKISFWRELFGLKPKNRSRTAYNHNI